MREIWTARVGQAAVRYGEHAPVATACCNACRTCVTTNLLGLALGAVAAAGEYVRRHAVRSVVPPRAR